jgi:hypothetical protein
MKISKPISLAIMLSLLILSACTGAKSVTSAITLTPTKAALTGHVITTYDGKTQPLNNTVVRLAKVFWNNDKSDGAFVVEGGTSPSVITNLNGDFAFTNIDPADYVVVVGDLEGENEIIPDTNGKAKIFTVEADKILDIGTLKVKLQPK